YSRQIHLHQRLLDGGLPPFIPLHNRGLKRQPPQLRYPQRHFSGLGLELALVVAGSAVDPLRRALVALCPRSGRPRHPVARSASPQRSSGPPHPHGPSASLRQPAAPRAAPVYRLPWVASLMVWFVVVW